MTLHIVTDDEPAVALNKNPLAVTSAMVDLQHIHTFQLGGSVCSVEHHHGVDPDASEHVHYLAKTTSYGRFSEKALEGARRKRDG